jgi:UDP-N-acetyl-D-glucosamine dehydrogenase
VQSYSLNLSHSERLRTKIESRTAKVGVIGMGYVGLPLALLFSEPNFPVTGFDIDRNKIEVLESGSSYIYRIAPSEVEAARDVRSAALEHTCADR